MRRTVRVFKSLAAAYLVLLLGNCIPTMVAAEPQNDPGRRYFSEEVVVFGRDEEGHEILLTVMLCRKEDRPNNTFVHYRFLTLIAPGFNKSLTDTFSDPHPGEVPHDFVKRFSNRGTDDLSARESYELGLGMDGASLDLSIPSLEGDFVVKSSPEYTKLVSESPAELKLNGRVYRLRAVVEKIYSSDFATYLFFPGYGKTRSETHGFVLWDEENNLYILDTSNVEDQNPSYRSHTWALFKDVRRRMMQKGFEAHVALRADANPLHWDISIPPFEVRKLTLDAVAPRADKPEEGIARGTIDTSGGIKKISGFYVHHVYH